MSIPVSTLTGANTINQMMYNVNTIKDLAANSASAITGPGSSTDNAVVRWDGTNGLSTQNSGVTIADDGTLSAPGVVSTGGVSSAAVLDITVNNIALRMKDTAGTMIPVAFLSGSNQLLLGTFTAPATNGDVLIYAAGSERARIDSSGHLNVGLTGGSGFQQFNVAENIAFGANGGARTTTYTIGVGDDGLTNFWKVALDIDAIGGNGIQSDFVIRTRDGDFSASGLTEKLRLTNAGNVGIGTTTPLSPLHVRESDNSTAAYQITAENDGGVNHTASYAFMVSSSGSETRVPKALISLQRTAAQGVGTFRIAVDTSTDVNPVDATNAVYEYLGGSDYHRWLTTGSERMRLDASGNLGIGITLPARRLELSDAASNFQARIGVGSIASSLTYDLGRNSATGLFHFYGNQSGYNGYVFEGVDRVFMTMLNNGNVGIGATSPVNGKLVVDGGQAGTNTSSAAFITPSSAQGLKADLALYSTFENTGDNGARRTADVIAGFNGGAWGNEYLSFNVGNNGASNDSRVVTSEKVRIESSGNVGIGTSVPRAPLHVSPAGNASDDFNVLVSQYRPNIVLEDLSTSATDFQLFVDNNALQFRYGDASTDTKLATEAMSIYGGRVGIGRTPTINKLEVAGTIESTTGGFKFPDGSTQTSAAASAGKAIAMAIVFG